MEAPHYHTTTKYGSAVLSYSKIIYIRWKHHIMQQQNNIHMEAPHYHETTK
jgi:hypothetical protein